MDEVLRANTSSAQEAKENTEKKWEFIKLPQHSNYIHLKKK